MKIFVSYPSDQRDLAERLRLALEGEGHEVFTDRAELKEGEPFHAALRAAIDDSDAMVFVVTPRAVAPGSYALSELDQAERRWRTPGGRVLPVMVEPTPLASIPAYLRSVTLLEPRGDIVAETVAAVARMRHGWPLAAWIALAVALVLVAAAAAWGWQRHQQQLAQALARQQREAAELAAATQLCSSGSHAVGWDQFSAIAAARPDDEPVRLAREDCAMTWLRGMRRVGEQETFSAQVAKLQPALAQGLSRSTGVRRADLRAHLGWAEFLRSRDGVSAGDPQAQYEAALADDPANPYALSMAAHHRVWTSGELDARSEALYAAAVKSGRARAWVRTLQFASAYQHRGLYAYAAAIADDMRRQGESPSDAQAERLRGIVFDSMIYSPRERADLRERVAPADLQATYDWLFPATSASPERAELDRLFRAWLAGLNGRTEEARRGLESLRRDLLAAKAEGRLPRAVDELLAELRRG